jgi:hypothetical protein
MPLTCCALRFRRFVRAHASRDSERGVRSAGLGLAIAAECAEAVGVNSSGIQRRRGTSLLVTVPRNGGHVAGADGSSEIAAVGPRLKLGVTVSTKRSGCPFKSSGE